MPAAGSPQEQQQVAEQRATAGEGPKARRLTAAPGQAGAPGVAEGQGQDPRDAALAALVQPRAGAGAHAVGLSPADKTYAEQLKDQAARVGSSLDGAVQQNRDAVQAFGQQSAALAQQAQAGTAAFLDDQKRGLDSQKTLARESAEAQRRTDARLADLQAQGVDPNRYWQSRTTGEKIGAALLIGLGQFAAGPLGPHGTRGENVPLQMINGAIRDELDSQKANLAKSIEVEKMRGESSARGFDQQMAMLRAERESATTAYTIAQNEITRRMGMFKDNADLQMRGTQMIQGLQNEKERAIAASNDGIYRLNKSGERVVGGGQEDLGKQVRELATKIYLDSKGEVSVEEARRKAFSLVVGPDAKPGEGQTAWGPSAKGKGPSAKEQSEMNATQDALSDLDEMIKLRKKHNGGSFSPEETTRGKAFAAAASERRLAGLGRVNKQLFAVVHHLVPEDPLELNAAGIIGSDPTMAKMETARNILQKELDRRQQGGGGGGSANENPAGLEEDEEK